VKYRPHFQFYVGICMRRLGRPSDEKEGAFASASASASASGTTHLLFFCLTGVETHTGIEYLQPISTIHFTQAI
jgi:hypothetical protein